MEKGISSSLGKRAILAVLGVGAIALALGMDSGASKEAADRVPGEMIVKLHEGQGFSAQNTMLDALSATGVNVLEMEALKTQDPIYRVKIAEDVQLQSAMQAMEENPSVKYAEPNFIYTIGAAGIPNDPDFDKLWSLHNTGQNDAAGQRGTPGSDINVVPVWEEGFTGSRDIVVAVIDTGVDWEHPDLLANLYTNPGEIEGNGIDDDGNGFVDDIHGWDFSDDTNTSDDDHNHGTHCAGTIGATGNNNQAIVGVNWNVSIMPIKFLTASGSGSLADALESINYATLMNVDVMSNSWGGGGHSQAMKDAIIAARDKGILFVAAAGNDRGNNNDSNPKYPASYQVENVVSVAATDNQDGLAYFSNVGRNSVHVAAPGVKIYSTVKGGDYASYSGTSMATPHVSGIAALLMSADSSLDYAEIKTRMIETSDPMRHLRRAVVAGGRVNTYNALHGIVPPSDEPDDSLWQDVEMVIESPHPYEVSKEYEFDVSYPGAKYIRVHFERVELESGYDKVKLIEHGEDRNQVVEELSGTVNDYMTDYVKGDTATLKLTSDYSVTKWGFKVDRIQVILDDSADRQ